MSCAFLLPRRLLTFLDRVASCNRLNRSRQRARNLARNFRPLPIHPSHYHSSSPLRVLKSLGSRPQFPLTSFFLIRTHKHRLTRLRYRRQPGVSLL